ncbi:hypothetical protein Trydic_g18933 [Trypoxylus dichotomus]
MWTPCDSCSVLQIVRNSAKNRRTQTYVQQQQDQDYHLLASEGCGACGVYGGLKRWCLRRKEKLQGAVFQYVSSNLPPGRGFTSTTNVSLFGDINIFGSINQSRATSGGSKEDVECPQDNHKNITIKYGWGFKLEPSQHTEDGHTCI